MTVCITFANHKGGVAKTASTVIAAQVLARAGKRVLVIDCDSQGNASEALCPKGSSPIELPSIDICLADPEKTPYCAVQSWCDNVLLIPASISMERPFPTAVTDVEKLPVIYRIPLDAIQRIRAKIESLDGVDLILIDTPPSLGLTTQAALHAADMIVLPCTPAKHAIFGLPDVVSVAATVSDAPHKVLITLADNRTRADSLGRKHLLAKFDVIGEVPKFSRISDNISSRRYPMGRVDPKYAAEIEALFMRIYDTAAALKKKGR